MLFADSPLDGRQFRRGEIEFALAAQGTLCGGVDEVGRGCLAGPVFAGFVSLNYATFRLLSESEQDLIRDSKKLSASQRATSVKIIEQTAIHIGVASASEREIEQIGIQDAVFLAMRRAIAMSGATVSRVLVDGNRPIKALDTPQTTVVKGDTFVFAIAAAAILAKETRDRYMRDQAKHYPEFGFDDHVGYGTKAHLEALTRHGPCTMHRMNFAPMKNSGQLRT